MLFAATTQRNHIRSDSLTIDRFFLRECSRDRENCVRPCFHPHGLQNIPGERVRFVCSFGAKCKYQDCRNTSDTDVDPTGEISGEHKPDDFLSSLLAEEAEIEEDDEHDKEQMAAESLLNKIDGSQPGNDDESAPSQAKKTLKVKHAFSFQKPINN